MRADVGAAAAAAAALRPLPAVAFFKTCLLAVCTTAALAEYVVLVDMDESGRDRDLRGKNCGSERVNSAGGGRDEAACDLEDDAAAAADDSLPT